MHNLMMHPRHTQLVTLLVSFIAINSISHANCHAISEPSESAAPQGITKEHKQDDTSKPSIRWLSAKTAISSETQLDLPPVLRPSAKSEIIDQAFDRQVLSMSTPATLAQASSSSNDQEPEINPNQSTRSSWIANFVSHAERINSNEQQLRDRNLNLLSSKHPENESELHTQIENATLPDYTPSQAPTDSEEDPLELPITDTNQNDQVAKGATSNETAPSRYSAQDSTKQSESNNVIAALHTIYDTEEGNPLVVTVSNKQVLTCEQAYHRCSSRKVCAQALSVYDAECRGLISNWTDKCSPRCLQAMIALWSSDEGENLVSCDCESNEYCLQNKNRSLICRPEVQKAIKPDSIVSCSTASAICQADQLCSSALEYYYRNCQSLFSQGHCSMRCNNSLAILYRQPKASKLINCQCDGSEDFPCVKYKTYTERFCLNRYDPKNLLVEFEEDNSEMANTAIEEDRLSEGDGDAYDASSGEQSIGDDNWIHLVSGRYFTNLQQHQQRFGQHQQQRYIDQHRTHKQIHQQQQRRNRNNTKHKARSYENAGRANVFALTASSAGSGHLYHNNLVYLVISLVSGWALARTGLT